MSDIFNSPISHPDVHAIIRMVLGASEIINEIYESEFEVSYKQGDEPVTIADKQADSFLINYIKTHLPDDEILTEEHGFYSLDANGSKRLWIIDPIDGTREFINKTGEFSIQIGLAVSGVLSLGAIYQPTAHTLYVGAAGEGCWQFSKEKDWKRLYINPDLPKELTVAVSRSFPCPTAMRVHELLHGVHRVQHGGVGLKLMAITNHEAHYYINHSNKTKSWDSAAPELLFKEAGGFISDLQGNAFDYDPRNYRHNHGLLASASKDLHEKILNLLNKG